MTVCTYRKYLENKLRETFPYPGLPVIFKQRGREPKDQAGSGKGAAYASKREGTPDPSE